MALTLVLLIPLIGAALAISFPNRHVGPIAALTTLVQVGFAIPMLIRFQTTDGLQQSIDKLWIPDLGVHFAVALDGLNIFMVVLTVLAWTIATFAASRRQIAQPRVFYAMLALAEVGTLGAFLAQDLILFILCFDLLLVPFFILIGGWGNGDRRAATTKFVIYTLAGSLLMFAAAIALAVESSAQNGSELSFAFNDLVANPVSSSVQTWVLVGFAFALLIKMPLPPLHGWMPDTYKAAPLAVLIPLSAVVAKLGAYGFLRIVLPQLPEAVQNLETLFLVLSLVGIFYGSFMAFTQDNVRLIVGYSSIAQMGFIGLGIFALDPKGAQGAIMQLLNHGIVVIALFLIIGLLAERAGSDLLSRMGGIATRAPVLASLFLIVSFATLAMPGSPNFVGELYILFGAFDNAFVYGAIATFGVVLAAVYMIRFYQRAMHGPVGDGVAGRELNSADLGLLAPIVLILLALAVYPQFVVERIAPASEAALTTVEQPFAGAPMTVAAEAKPR